MHLIRWKKYLLSLTILVVVAVITILLFGARSGSSPAAIAKRTWLEFQQWLQREPEADILLPIVFDRQDHALSCEAADLKMILTYRGIIVSEDQLLADIGIDPTPKQIKDEQVIWGDPNKAFVGNVDGRMMQTGYGVYWEPVATAANKYRKAEVITNGTAAQVAEYLTQGHPVIIWSYLGSGKRYQWQTPDGRTIDAVYSEHPVVVRGFKGMENNPEGFFVINPLYGYKYLTTSDFMTHWSAFERNGIVVY